MTLDLRVIGKDRVTVPAGTFDCWRIEVQTPRWDIERSLIWVSRDKGWLIKQERRGSDPNYVIIDVLESYQPVTWE